MPRIEKNKTNFKFEIESVSGSSLAGSQITISPDTIPGVWAFLFSKPKNKVFSGKTEALPGGYSGLLHRFSPRPKNQWLNCILSRSEFDSNPRSLNKAAVLIYRTISQWRPRPGLCLSVGDGCCTRKSTGLDKARLVLDHIIF